MNIGLHSQTLNDFNGIIAGSEITTGYLSKAFVRLNGVNNVLRFAPGNYQSLSLQPIDFMLIEGWHPALTDFISMTRKLHPKAKIIFWNLSFLGFAGVLKLDVDGYLSNSKKNAVLLNNVKPSKFVMLAADSFAIEEVDRTKEVVYLGLNHPKKSEQIEKLILREAMEFDFSIYGSGWETHTSLFSYWKGKLPQEQLNELYLSSKIVLGTTEDRQRRVGMINNRVFEALSCGACFISDYFPELEKVFGELIFYSRIEGDTKKTIQKILNDPTNMLEHRKRVSSFIQAYHTYDQRVIEIMEFYTSLL